jgi:hypothetical protein
MYHDFLQRERGNQDLAVNRMLLQLAHLFKNATTKKMSEFGLPEPQEQDTELQIERITYEVSTQALVATALLAENPLTEEMQMLYDDIMAALQVDDIDQRPPFIAILQGIAGAGKSTFVKYVMASVRALGFIAKGCASTGLAAAVYEDFSTAHSLFAIPVIDDEEDFDQEGDLQCRLHLAKYEEARPVNRYAFLRMGRSQLAAHAGYSLRHGSDGWLPR